MFNLANQYQANRMHTEALNTYLLIVKNKMFSNGARLRINMGNIYFEQRKYPLAIKMYRMALDQIQNTHSQLRQGCVHILSCSPPLVTATHSLVLCMYVVG